MSADDSQAETDALVGRIMVGDEAAATKFADVFGPRLRRFYLKRNGGLTADAEEMANTCLYKVISAIHKGKYRKVAGVSIEAFLFAIARNTLSDWWKERRRIHFMETPLDETREAEPEPLSPDMEIVSAVDDAMMLLSDGEEKIISLRHFNAYELSFEEIGHCLGIQESNARVRYFRAINKLRSMLEADLRVQRVLMRRTKSAESHEQNER